MDLSCSHFLQRLFSTWNKKRELVETFELERFMGQKKKKSGPNPCNIPCSSETTVSNDKNTLKTNNCF